MNKVSAGAFVVVLLFVAVASYIIYNNIQGDLRQHLPFVPGDEPTATLLAESQPTATPQPPTPPPSTPTWTPSVAATHTPQPTAPFTPTPVPSTPTTTPLPMIRVQTPTSIPTATPATVTLTPGLAFASPSPTAGSSPTPTVAGKYTYYLEGAVVHDLEASCVAQYIRGIVRDRKGNLLEGVQIRARDLWGNESAATSKGGPDVGKWDIVLGPTENVWNVVVVDAGGNVISPVAVVPHHKEGDFKLACTHIVNWRRAW
jgi:hypothetical protein